MVKHPDRAEADRFWNFPYAAIEEAVINAVYHRSYEIREPIEVRITPRDFVVLSFPGPDRSIKVEALRQGKGVSRRYRNRRIGEFLKELDLTEGRSTEISKILKAMKTNGSPLPEFETDDDRSYFLIRLPVHPGVASEELSQETSAKSEVVREKWGEKWGEKIMARRLRIAQLMIDNPGISTKELARALKLSTSGVENHLKAMRTAGCIRHVGPAKGGHWEVIE